MNPKPIKYDVDQRGSIILPDGPPFDGKEVLIQLATGWCEAWWDGDIIRSIVPDSYGEVLSGWSWVCMDDDFRAELDEARYWMPLPTIQEEKEQS